MVVFVEILRAIASVLLIFSAAFYLRHLEKTKNKENFQPLNSQCP
ncbi:hypothetical protein J6TS1_17860 [Siminovitchia terrae]|uniref:Uncharacterized protein n=1 Tax=Siminovitchia terrae TaxID=1914933 RepID=A0ABQ4KV87_SIMTE|nr:hypothetical protein J22TS1_47470 [Siminovitchia terrae]GIN95916.1 hypothetical protein J6TS1_17860 [Siminovitchia terrae]